MVIILREPKAAGTKGEDRYYRYEEGGKPILVRNKDSLAKVSVYAENSDYEFVRHHGWLLRFRSVNPLFQNQYALLYCLGDRLIIELNGERYAIDSKPEIKIHKFLFLARIVVGSGDNIILDEVIVYPFWLLAFNDGQWEKFDELPFLYFMNLIRKKGANYIISALEKGFYANSDIFN